MKTSALKSSFRDEIKQNNEWYQMGLITDVQRIVMNNKVKARRRSVEKIGGIKL